MRDEMKKTILLKNIWFRIHWNCKLMYGRVDCKAIERTTKCLVKAAEKPVFRNQYNIVNDWVCLYLLNATNALAFSTDSFFCNCSHAGNDHRNRPNLSILPDCWSTSQTQATCSWVKPNEGIIAGDWGLGHEEPDRPTELDIGPNWALSATAALVIPGIWMADTSFICPTIITIDKRLYQFIKLFVRLYFRYKWFDTLT